MKLAIDAQTAARVRDCLQRCARDGVDPARALDREGLLHHPVLDFQIRKNMVLKAASALEDATLAQIARDVRIPSTALDTKRLIVKWLRGMAEAAQMGGEG